MSDDNKWTVFSALSEKETRRELVEDFGPPDWAPKFVIWFVRKHRVAPTRDQVKP